VGMNISFMRRYYRLTVIIIDKVSIYIYRVIRNDCRGFNNLPPRSTDATPCGFFQWGYVKDQVYVFLFPQVSRK